jgi:hypothetical protein
LSIWKEYISLKNAIRIFLVLERKNWGRKIIPYFKTLGNKIHTFEEYILLLKRFYGCWRGEKLISILLFKQPNSDGSLVENTDDYPEEALENLGNDEECQ